MLYIHPTGPFHPDNVIDKHLFNVDTCGAAGAPSGQSESGILLEF